VPQVVRVRGRGRVTVPAFGIADAEHLVGKELTRLWPGVSVHIDGVRRAGGGRVVEEFEVEYRVEGDRPADDDLSPEAESAVFRELNRLLAGTRYARTEWERAPAPSS
jgi:hypothetical protein